MKLNTSLQQSPLQQISLNCNNSSYATEEEQYSLGLEKHVQHVFMQTQNTIRKLNTELDEYKKVNDELSQKLIYTNNQKQSQIQKNKKLDSELKDYKSQVDDLLKCKNDYKQTQVQMKKNLQQLMDNYELKKKQLQHEINQLMEEQTLIEDEKNRENAAFEQATKQWLSKINSVSASNHSTDLEIKKYESLIQKLQEKDKQSMESIINETGKFKDFLENQEVQSRVSSLQNSRSQLKQQKF